MDLKQNKTGNAKTSFKLFGGVDNLVRKNIKQLNRIHQQGMNLKGMLLYF